MVVLCLSNAALLVAVGILASMWVDYMRKEKEGRSTWWQILGMFRKT